MIQKTRFTHCQFPLLTTIGQFCTIGCKEANHSKEEIVEKQEYIPQKNEVDVQIMQKQPFKEELLANGKTIVGKRSEGTF